MGRPPTKTAAKRIHLLLNPDLLKAAESVRDKSAKESLTAQVEDGLRRHIAARRRKLQPPSDD